jgi:AcrR family transcriptional regulator
MLNLQTEYLVMDETENTNTLQTTEQSIKEAAKFVFLKKGFSATKTRDIAEQAGENLALINYYFRSKQNLFKIVMTEIFHEFLESIIPVFNNPDTTIKQKIEAIVDNNLTLFIQQPDIPLFILTEMSDNSGCFTELNGQKMELMLESVFHHQLVSEYGDKGINPEHVILNIVGMTLYPFLGKAMMNGMKGIDDSCFNDLMEERRKLIPIWTMSMLNGPQE